MRVAKIGEKMSPITGEVMYNGKKMYQTVDFGMVDESEVVELEEYGVTINNEVAKVGWTDGSPSQNVSSEKPKKKGRPKKVNA